VVVEDGVGGAAELNVDTMCGMLYGIVCECVVGCVAVEFDADVAVSELIVC